MNEKQVFIKYAEMMGWDISMTPQETFINPHTDNKWTGWKARAMVHEAIEQREQAEQTRAGFEALQIQLGGPF